MNPTISLGPVEVGTYFLTYLAAIAVGIVGFALRDLGSVRPRGHDRVPPDYAINGIFWVIVSALAGGWFVTALPELVHNLIHGWQPLTVRFGRFGWLGQLGGGSLAGYLVLRSSGRPVGLDFDHMAPILPLAQAVGRVGCVMAGCCHGIETTAWPAMVLPDTDGIWASRFPTQFADILANLLIAAVILGFERYARRKGQLLQAWPFNGFLFLIYVWLYCLQRFFVEFWRDDWPVLFGPFTWTHLYCAIGFALASVLFARNVRRGVGTTNLH